jgi:drug/metabolite transporter (DMT)-like permease
VVRTPSEQRRALAIALVLIVVWGFNFTVQKLIFPVLEPGGFLFVRYLIMPACAALWMIKRYGVDWPPVDRGDVWLLLRLAIAGHVLHVGMVTWGIHLSTAFSSSVILACGPLYTLLLLRFTGAERLLPAQIAGVLVACAGVLVFLSDKFTAGAWTAGQGDLILLVAASFFSYYTVAAKPLIEKLGGIPVMAYATLIASPLLVAITWQPAQSIDWTGLDWRIWIAVLWAVIVSAFLGWVVWGWVNAVRGVARTAPLIYLMPLVAGTVAWAVLGERFTAVKLVGAGITLVGVALAQAGTRLWRPGSGRR